ncbi:MAG: MATE family efflux transporter [Anaerovoracaceae bacterium]
MEKDKTKYEESKMGTMPINRLLSQMAWPAILSMTINALYNIVDSIFVAMISEDALTAVSLILPIHLLMISVGVGSGVGVNSLISRKLGARNFEDANKAASTSIRIALLNFVGFAVLGIFFATPFINSYQTNDFISENAIAYFKITTIFSCFLMIQIILEKVLQATGNMIAPMLFSLTGAIVNIILDPILIFGLFGAPKLGVPGAAIATVIGQFCAMCLAIFIVFTREHEVIIKVRGFKLDWKVVKDIYVVGLPSIIMQSIGSVMLIGYNAILATVSSTAVAVLGAYFKFQSFVFMPVFGLNQGAMPIMGYNYGARDKKRLMETYKKALVAAMVVMTLGMVIFQVFPRQLLMLFSASDDMIAMGVPALRIISICFIPAAFGIITSTFFQGTGHGVYSLMASVLRQLVGILPIAYFLVKTAGITASWLSFPIAELIGLTYSAVAARHLYKKEIKDL